MALRGGEESSPEDSSSEEESSSSEDYCGYFLGCAFLAGATGGLADCRDFVFFLVSSSSLEELSSEPLDDSALR